MILKDGLRVQLMKGEQNFDGPGKHSDCGEWIAGRIPVGSTGTIRVAADVYPFIKTRSLYCIIWDHNPTPKEGYCWGLVTDFYFDNGCLQVIDS